ncbi:MAG TPA: phosphorylase [Candidatus Binatia bacterium]
MLGIVVSLPWELKSLTRETIPIGAWKAISANILVALSGIGAERAYTAGSVLVSQGATALLSWGYAAALDDRLKAGCLLLPKLIIGANGAIHSVNTEWHHRLLQTLETRQCARTEALVESPAIVKTSAEKRTLAQRTKAAATDMESAAHARLAEERRLPFVAIRAIIDTASTDIPENVLEALSLQGDISVWKLLTSAHLRPADWIRIVKLGIQFNAAQRTLKKTRHLVLDPPRL